MVPSFRRGILSIPPEELYNPNIDPADNILIQLQHLFAAMEASETAVVNPSAFCHALKDFDGNPTDIMLQQDATEFLIKFFQQANDSGLIYGV